MKLYFAPLACSLATRCAVYEAGADVVFVEVDSKAKRTAEGADYLGIHGLGLVPLLELDDGRRLAENAAILQFLADAFPEARLAPTDRWDRARLQQWLSFVGSELHKPLATLLDPAAGAERKAHARGRAEVAVAWIADQLAGREFLLERFSVADLYLFAVLNWCAVTGVDLGRWAAVQTFQRRMLQRPSCARAFAEERELYVAELQRHGATPEMIAALRQAAG